MRKYGIELKYFHCPLLASLSVINDTMNVFIPFENMSQSKNFVSTAGRLWNVLPADLKCDSNLNMFKFKLKKLFLSGAL